MCYFANVIHLTTLHCALLFLVFVNVYDHYYLCFAVVEDETEQIERKYPSVSRATEQERTTVLQLGHPVLTNFIK